MLLNALSKSLLSTFLFSATTLAAPTRTHCRCQVVLNTVPTPAIYTPAAAHWTPVNPSPANASPSPNTFVSVPVALDACASLVSKLEWFRDTEPELYEWYMHTSSSSRNDNDDDAATLAAAAAAAAAQKPIPTSVPLSQKETEQNSEPRSKPLPADDSTRIECFSEPAAMEELAAQFQSSFLGLWVLQTIVAVAVLACVVEVLHVCQRWIQYHSNTNTSTTPSSPPSSSSLHLSGAQECLAPIPTGPQDAQQLCSACLEKLKAHDATRYFGKQGKSERSASIAYEDDSDDESNMSVL